MEKIKIGVLGCADIAKRMLVPNILATDKFEIVAFASRSMEKAKEFSNLFGGKEVLGYENLLKMEEIEAIYIPLPTGLHYEWIMKSLKSGKHVFSEKSISINFNEVLEIIEEAKNKKLCVFENFMFPFHSQFKFVKEKLENGVIGDVKLFKSTFGFPIFNLKNNIRYQKSLGGGALLDAGAYTLMASQLFLGQNQTVIASTSNNSGFNVDFQGTILLKNENDVISQLAFGFDNFYQNNIEIWGSKGRIIMERAFTAGPDHFPKIVIENQNEKHEYQLSRDNHFIKILDTFYYSIKENNYSFQFKQIISQSRLLNDARNKKNISIG